MLWSTGHSPKLKKLVTILNVENVNKSSNKQVMLKNKEKGVNQFEDARHSIETNQSEQTQVGYLQVCIYRCKKEH